MNKKYFVIDKNNGWSLAMADSYSEASAKKDLIERLDFADAFDLIIKYGQFGCDKEKKMYAVLNEPIKCAIEVELHGMGFNKEESQIVDWRVKIGDKFYDFRVDELKFVDDKEKEK